MLIPHSFNGTDITGWEFTGSLSSSNFDKESGVITVENDGFYMLTSALNFENVNKLIEAVEVYIILNDGILKNFTVDLRYLVVLFLTLEYFQGISFYTNNLRKF